MEYVKYNLLAALIACIVSLVALIWLVEPTFMIKFIETLLIISSMGLTLCINEINNEDFMDDLS